MNNSFIGFVPNSTAGENFIKDVRNIIKGSGYWVRRYGRNPNRAQFYPSAESRRRFIGDLVRKHDYAQNLPRKHALTFALYLDKVQSIGYSTNGRAPLLKLRGEVEVIKKLHGF